MSADPDYIAAVDGDASPADPGEIDLEKAKEVYEAFKISPLSRHGYCEEFMRDFAPALIAAVPVARARVEEYDKSLNWQNGQIITWKKRAEAAEARVVELVGALEAQCTLIENNPMLSACASSTLEPARTILAATPARAMERARAVEGKGYAAGLEAAAEFHEKYAAKAEHKAKGSGVLIHKMSWHNWSAEAIRALNKEEKENAPKTL